MPCIESHGYDLPVSPSRDEFAATAGYLDWNPYDSLGNSLTPESANELYAECPYQVPGIY